MMVLCGQATGREPHGRYLREILRYFGIRSAGLVAHPSIHRALLKPDHLRSTRIARQSDAPMFSAVCEDVMGPAVATPALFLSSRVVPSGL